MFQAEETAYVELTGQKTRRQKLRWASIAGSERRRERVQARLPRESRARPFPLQGPKALQTKLSFIIS